MENAALLRLRGSNKTEARSLVKKPCFTGGGLSEVRVLGVRVAVLDVFYFFIFGGGSHGGG